MAAIKANKMFLTSQMLEIVVRIVILLVGFTVRYCKADLSTQITGAIETFETSSRSPLSMNNHVPLIYLSNISNLNPTLSIIKEKSMESSLRKGSSKVPSTISIINGGSNPSSTSSNSIYVPNYNSQQNVKQLVSNIDSRLRNVRNVEMRVATIQEIFDSLDFTSSTNSFGNFKNISEHNSQNSISHLEKDLQIFSKRLTKKLQKAQHVVMELKDFFHYNITKYLMQRHLFNSDYTNKDDDDIENVDDDDDNDDDIEVESEDDGFESEIDNGRSLTFESMKYCLHTFIQPCQNIIDPSRASPTSILVNERDSSEHYNLGKMNYNKQQIQILNYLKADQSRSNEIDNQLHQHQDDYYFEANTYIVEKIQSLKNSLTAKNIDITSPGSIRRPPTDNMDSTKLKILSNHFKHIYFLSRSDHASDQSERFNADINFRHLYVSAIKLKHVLLLLDIGSAITPDLLELTKGYVANILQLLTSTDLISIITVSDEAKIMLLSESSLFGHNANNEFNDINQHMHGVYHATRERKDEILNYINNLNIAGFSLTNHSLAFEYAFEFLHNLQNINETKRIPMQFVYVTRGLLTNLSDSMQVLNVIANGQRKLQQPIIINTCAVVLDEKRIMYEKQFLTDISTQNYTKYDINVSSWKENAVQLNGKFFVLTKMHPEIILRACIAIFDSLFKDPYLRENIYVHPPIVDYYSKDSIISITHTVQPYGIVGVNLYLADLIEDVASYQQTYDMNANKNDYIYAFLIDRTGLTIAHPAFPRPNIQTQTPFPVDIGFLENSTDFSSIRLRMLHDETGSITTTVVIENLRRSGKSESVTMNRTYRWQSILNVYVLCLVSTTKQQKEQSSTIQTANRNQSIDNPPISTLLHLSSNMPLVRFSGNKETQISIGSSVQYATNMGNKYEYMSVMDLIYHRLDLMPANGVKMCRYFKQIATMDAATLFLSSSAFESPFTYLHNSRTASQQTQAESIMPYIKDSTGLLANPGLRPQIRNEVNALYNAMQHLKKRHQDSRSSMKNYIIRRYIATVSGVLQVYPGCLLSNNYDPTRRSWFLKAMEQPGKIITTEPYLDAGGAGYIITIAHTILEGKSNALHSIERDQAVAIVALDLPYTYYYKMILDNPLCQNNHIKCLLFENEGYLLAHPTMLEPSTLTKNHRRPHEHLTHKEPYLANDILYHKHLVKKLACANYQNRTIQRYYVFNTSLADVLTNVVHGEKTKYAITLVRGTNIFAAVLNSTLDGGAFCPCSTIDRICLNCNRMDSHDCECPCECPMDLDAFAEMYQSEDSKPFFNYTQQYSYCTPPSEHFVAIPTTSDDYTVLNTCVNINCDVYGTQNDCLAVMGCEWCQQDLDGNGFSSAFCTAQASCFNGVLSSLTPYGELDNLDMIAAHGYNPSQIKNSYSAFGPIGGAIVVLAIIIGFAIYCYRHSLESNGQDQFYMDSMQEENYGLPLSRFNFDDCQANDDPPGGLGYDHPSAQRNLIHPVDISPYHMSTGSSYRRPPNGESDHGYSTMTPHEDSSDHQCFTLAEPLLLNDKRNSKSDTLSISTSISSPTNRHHNNQNHNNQYHHQHQLSSSSSSYYNNPSESKHSSKESRCYSHITSPKKYHHYNHQSPSRVYEQTTLPLNDSTEETPITPNYILAPVTVHRHMEASES